MKCKTLILASILFASCLGIAFHASAERPTTGLSKGDVFYYEMCAEYSSSNPRAVIKIPPFEANNTSWVKIEITDVSDSIISHLYVLHFKDGNETLVKGQTDLSSSSGYCKGFRGIPICPSNLDIGDTLLGGQLTVNNIQTRTFPAGARQLIGISWNSTIDYGECYFDRQTGILMELFHVHLYINSETNESINKTDIVKLTNSSIW